MSAMRVTRAFFSGLLCAGLVLAPGLSAQDTGFLAGVVTDGVNGRPIAGAKVSLPDQGVGVTTSATGEFTLDNVRPGSVSVRFEALGYASITEELALSAVEFLQVRLMGVAAALDEIVVITGRTPRSRRARAVDVSQDEPPSTSVLDLLADRIPGVTVLRGGGNIGGGGTAVTIRGVGTFQGNTAPDVYLDGVRLDGRDTGEHAMHILERLPAAEVSRIRVLKGADAAAYPFSANGVIVVETHRGGG
ncbi:MAG: carboxypeptidase regulatory-like domain-containing protein [Gemmatimonadota bacterium]